ncbi:MAG: cysteine--tRNA ligase [Calditrichia bacterium]
MAVTIYNTLTRKKEEFVPIHPNRVHIYVCGPTVYGHPHIGHAKSYISFDVVVRYFRYLGYRVKYVQNITDVGHLTDDADAGEDKIIKKAREEGLDPMEIAEYYTWSYFEDMQALGVLKANIFPRATGHILEQIEFIKGLIEKGHAYEVNGNVYFDVSTFAEYGKLSGRKVDELLAGARVDPNPEKRHPADFALWKRAEKGHLMRWNSPWGEGYPGWHIECSTMSMKYLGETIDIHGGGIENVFPHHECEIAQSEALTGKPFVRYWMHNNMVTVDGTKMGKSLGNFITLKEALEKHKPETLRYFVLSSHYRSPLDFSDAALDSAEKGLSRLLKTVALLKEKLATTETLSDFTPPFSPAEFREKFESAMNDDFNTPRAIAVLFDLAKEVNSYLNGESRHHQPFLQEVEDLYSQLGQEVLGLIPRELENQAAKEALAPVEKVIQIAIDVRQELRKNKQFQMADFIRNRLSEIGITLVDTPEGTSFQIKE